MGIVILHSNAITGGQFYEDTSRKKSLKIPYIEEKQTTQLPKEKVQKDKNNNLQNIHIKLKINLYTLTGV